MALVQSGSEAAVLIGDATHNPVEFTATDGGPLVDVAPSPAWRSWRAIVDHAARLHTYVTGTRFRASGPTFGRMIEIGGPRLWRGVSLP
jgi:hypothetical protein